MATTLIADMWGELRGALSGMATSEKPPRERLLLAVAWRIQRVLPPAMPLRDLPPAIIKAIQTLHRKLTRDGSFADSIAKMEEEEVLEAVEDVIHLFSVVSGAYIPEA